MKKEPAPTGKSRHRDGRVARLTVLATVAATSLLGLVTLDGLATHATTPGANGRIAFSMDSGAGPQIRRARLRSQSPSYSSCRR